jgi:hypothetical protein
MFAIRQVAVCSRPPLGWLEIHPVSRSLRVTKALTTFDVTHGS